MVKFNSDDNRVNNNYNKNYNSNSKYNRNNNKSKVNTTITNNDNNNNNINSSDDNNPWASKQRKRNIIWWNPRFIKNVAAKIGRYFLNLIVKHFPRDHKFHKIFNRIQKLVTVACQTLNHPSTHTIEKSISHLLTAKVEHVTALRKQTAFYMKNASVKIHYIKQILVRETLKQKSITVYQKQNLKQDIRTIKSPSTKKSTKMTSNCQMNSGKLKLQKKNQS